LGKDADKVKGILPVHFAGHPPDMEAVHQIAKKHDLWVVEDACHALGAQYRTSNGKLIKVGSCRHSDMTVFSFHPVKHITTGEGGAITTNNESLYQKLLKLRNHGITHNPTEFNNLNMAFTNGVANPWYYEMTQPGFNYRITDIQCALGYSQLNKIEQNLKLRRDIAARYDELLSKTFGDLIKPLCIKDSIEHAYHLYVVQIDFVNIGLSRLEVVQKLKENNIGTQVHYIPIHLQPYYQQRYGTKLGSFPLAELYYDQCLSLPIYPSMPDDSVTRVVAALERAFSRVLK